MTRLPELDATGYQEMLLAAAGHGHHAGGVAGADAGHDEIEEPAASDIHVHDDGTEHDHAATADPAEVELSADHDDTPHEHDDD